MRVNVSASLSRFYLWHLHCCFLSFTFSRLVHRASGAGTVSHCIGCLEQKDVLVSVVGMNTTSPIPQTGGRKACVPPAEPSPLQPPAVCHGAGQASSPCALVIVLH